MRLAFLRPVFIVSAALALTGSCVIDWDSIDPNADGQGASGANGNLGGGDSCTPGATVPCYSGPDGTEDVGICTGGTTTCLEDGSGFGACSGEVTPADQEDCDTPVDDNCNNETNELEAGCSCTPGTLVSCYDGPDGTEDVGLCGAGVKLCRPDGMSFTACVGEVLPRVEECLTENDDDCDGTANDGCPLWANRYGGSWDKAWAWQMHVASDGTSIIAGQTDGDIDFSAGSSPLSPPAGGDDAIIAGFDSDGAHLWSDRYGDDNHQRLRDVAVDGMGNTFIIGNFSGTIDLGGATTPLVASDDTYAFVAMLDSNGAAQWATSLGEPGATVEGRAIAFNPTGGDIAVGGYFSGSIDFGTSTGTLTATDEDGWIARIDMADGAVTWGMTLGAADDDAVLDLAADIDTGAIVAVGTYDESFQFGSQMTADATLQDGFVANISVSNTPQWFVTIGDGGNQAVHHVALHQNDIIVQGQADTTVVYDTLDEVAISLDTFVLKLDTLGMPLWHRHYAAIGNQTAGGIAVDTAGNVSFGVSQRAVVDYGGGALQSFGSDDWVIVGLSDSGDHRRSRRFGGTGDEDPRALGTDAAGNVYVVGDCSGAVDFGDGVLSSIGSEDICMTKLPP